MNITVNGEHYEQQPSGLINLEEIVVHLSRCPAIPDNHMVGTVVVNGNEFSESYPGQSREIGIEAIDDIDIRTVSLNRYSKAMLKDSLVLIERMVSSVKKTAEHFRMYNEAEAHEHFSNLIDSIRSLLQFIDRARQTTNWDFDKSIHDNQSVQIKWDRLLEIIDELGDVQTEGDLILLADLLEYELAPLLLTWKDIVNSRSETAW